MTAQLKTVKEPPLLSPPAESLPLPAWAAVTDEDKQAMRRWMSEYRRGKNGYCIAMSHHYMRGLGIHDTMTDDDRTYIREYQDKEYKNDYMLAEMHYLTHSLNIAVNVTEEHQRRIRNELNVFRERGGGDSVTEVLYFMHRIGLSESATQEDTKKVLEAQEHYRQSAINTPAYARMLHFALELNIPIEVTDEDVEMLRLSLDHARRDGNGLGISSVLYPLREILKHRLRKTAPQDDAQHIPPLRRFTK